MTDQRTTDEADEHLVFGAPPGVEATPSSFAFDRERDITIDWDDLLTGVASWKKPEPNEYLRNFVEAAWSGNFDWVASQAKNWLIELSTAAPGYEHDPESVAIFTQTFTTYAQNWTGKPLYTTFRNRIPPTAEKALTVDAGCAVRIPSKRGRDRWFRLLDESDQPIAASEFQTDWNGAWRKVESMRLIYIDTDAAAAQERARKSFSFTEILRSDEAVLRARFEDLEIERQLAVKYSELAAALLEKVKGESLAEVEPVAKEYRELTRNARSVDRRIAQLAQAAKDLGYYLVTKPEVRQYVDEAGTSNQQDLQVGELYRVNPTVRTWTVAHETHHKDWKGKVHYNRWTTRESQTFDHYVKAEVDVEPWRKIVELYRSQGLIVHFFVRRRDGQLVSEQNMDIVEVVEMLEQDEDLRVRSVLALPIHEQSILGDDVVVAYQLFGRPLPDLGRTDYPRLYVREALSYRFAWKGTSLGELAATIALSPGEEREVTAVVGTSRETKESYISTSLLDVSREDRQDFESLFEKEVRTETEVSQRASADLRGTYKGVTGSANFSRDKTTKDIVRTLNRAVQKTSSKLNVQQRTEVKIERSETTAMNTSSTVSYKVRNINDAVTLTVAFYRLMNQYESLLRVDDFSLVVESGRSLLAGWDVYQPQTFDLQDLGRLVDHLTREGNFPGDLANITGIEKVILKANLAAIVSGSNENAVGRPLIAADAAAPANLPNFFNLMTTKGISLAAATTAESSQYNLVNVLKTSVTGGDKAQTAADATEVEKSSAEINREAARQLKGLEFQDLRSEFWLDSGGFYADLVLGRNVGADPYAQERRKLELEKVRSEIDLNSARSAWLEQRLGGRPVKAKADKAKVDDKVAVPDQV